MYFGYILGFYLHYIIKTNIQFIVLLLFIITMVIIKDTIEDGTIKKW